MTYFALHGKLYAVIEKVLSRFDIYEVLLSNEITSSIVAIGITAVISVLLIIPAMIINRWFPWVRGERKSKIETLKTKADGKDRRTLFLT